MQENNNIQTACSDRSHIDNCSEHARIGNTDDTKKHMPNPQKPQCIIGQPSEKHYLQDTINAIQGIGQTKTAPCAPTGFAKLDKALGGGLYEGLSVIGAISSIGKTSFTMQAACQIALSGIGVIIFSLEEPRRSLMLKNISRETALCAAQKGVPAKNVARTARELADGSRYAGYSNIEREVIECAAESFGKYADNIRVYEAGKAGQEIGVRQIRNAVSEHISNIGSPPVVIVDFLQILAPNDKRSSDKQNTDRAVMELRGIGREFRAQVIAISSLNRQSYRDPVTMESFKESGAIEYISDVLIGMQLKGASRKDFDPTAEKAKNPRSVELVILKNREGEVGGVVPFAHYPAYSYFKEL